jgi:putative phosphoesterase
MSVLIVSDVHANWPALRAIDEPFDVCLCLGDLVDYGPDPGPCIDWAREHARYCVRGNHDHGVAQDVPVQGVGGFRYLTAVTRPFNRSVLDAGQLRYLAALPVTQWLLLDGRKVLLVHASPRDPLDEYGGPEEEFWARRLEDVDADLVLVGHTHCQFDLQVGRRRVINPGSVGLPRDGDPRAAYAVLDGDTVTFKRVDYPIEETVAAVQAATIPEPAREMLSAVYRNGKLVR